MKKYKLKGWVQVVLLLILSVIFILFFIPLEKNVLYMIIDKSVLAILFILIGTFLVDHSDMNAVK